jgi:hypothetical protein
MLDAEIRTTFDELCSFKLCTIVYQNSFGHAKSVYDTLQKLDRCLLGYIYYWHGLHPLGERVDPDKYVSEPTWFPGQNDHDVESPYCKRPGDIDRLKRIGMFHRLLLKELAISILLYAFHCVILCCERVKYMPECFTNDRAS